MGDPKAIVPLALVLLLAACAPSRLALLTGLRPPGERNRAFPEVVWEQYDCGRQRRPFFVIEENELAPARTRPGGSFQHRLVYAMCPTERTGVVPGRLHTRIRFRGRFIAQETDAGFELKPGRWVVDTSVDLPRDAEPGIYAYELDFQSDSIDFDEHLTFLVEAR